MELRVIASLILEIIKAVIKVAKIPKEEYTFSLMELAVNS